MWEQVEKPMQGCGLSFWCRVWIWHAQLNGNWEKRLNIEVQENEDRQEPRKLYFNLQQSLQDPSSLMRMIWRKNLVQLATELHIYLVQSWGRKHGQRHRSVGPDTTHTQRWAGRSVTAYKVCTVPGTLNQHSQSIAKGWYYFTSAFHISCIFLLWQILT